MIDAQAALDEVIEQRNDALNRCVFLAGEISKLKKELAISKEKKEPIQMPSEK